ncbi:MAG: hypothetical protein IJJ26_01405 [Victivallales bacterium]|nr:hypothetical protein [Victivallales bacterium]
MEVLLWVANLTELNDQKQKNLKLNKYSLFPNLQIQTAIFSERIAK